MYFKFIKFSRMIKKISPLIAGLLPILLLACAKDKLPVPQTECTENVTYKTDIETIIQSTCAYAGCHISGTPGILDYSTYNGLLAVVESGTFEERVLIQRNMPPPNATGPTSLTEEQLNLIRCWLEQGYPE